MKIGVDAREIQNGVITGIGRSLDNFIKYFQANEKLHKLVLFSENKIHLDHYSNLINVPIGHSSTFIWDQIRLPAALKKHYINLFYSPYYKIPFLTNIPIVNQILDLMWLGFPAYHNSLNVFQRLYYYSFGKAFANKSINIITDSEHAKKDIIQFWKIEENKISVIPLGLSNRYVPVKNQKLLNSAKEKFQLPDKFILYLGNFKPHKNVKSLVKSFKRVAKRFPNYSLVLAGPLDQYGRAIEQMSYQVGLGNKVLFTDTIGEKDQPEALLSLADVFVFPTLYEGFGLPPLEAMACGTPVVASNMTSVPEVIGDAGILIDPTDIGKMSDAICELLRDSDKIKIYSKKGLERAKFFREEKTTAKLYKHIISLLEKIK